VSDLVVLFLHLLATVARLAGPGGARSIVAESLLVKHQLLILNRCRKRSPNLRFSDRVVLGVSALLMRPTGGDCAFVTAPAKYASTPPLLWPKAGATVPKSTWVPAGATIS